MKSANSDDTDKSDYHQRRDKLAEKVWADPSFRLRLFTYLSKKDQKKALLISKGSFMQAVHALWNKLDAVMYDRKVKVYGDPTRTLQYHSAVRSILVSGNARPTDSFHAITRLMILFPLATIFEVDGHELSVQRSEHFVKSCVLHSSSPPVKVPEVEKWQFSCALRIPTNWPVEHGVTVAIITDSVEEETDSHGTSDPGSTSTTSADSTSIPAEERVTMELNILGKTLSEGLSRLEVQWLIEKLGLTIPLRRGQIVPILKAAATKHTPRRVVTSVLPPGHGESDDLFCILRCAEDQGVLELCIKRTGYEDGFEFVNVMAALSRLGDTKLKKIEIECLEDRTLADEGEASFESYKMPYFHPDAELGLVDSKDKIASSTTDITISFVKTLSDDERLLYDPIHHTPRLDLVAQTFLKVGGPLGAYKLVLQDDESGEEEQMVSFWLTGMLRREIEGLVKHGAEKDVPGWQQLRKVDLVPT